MNFRVQLWWLGVGNVYIQVNTLDSFTGKAFCSNLDIEKVKRKKGKSWIQTN